MTVASASQPVLSVVLLPTLSEVERQCLQALLPLLPIEWNNSLSPQPSGLMTSLHATSEATKANHSSEHTEVTEQAETVASETTMTEVVADEMAAEIKTPSGPLPIAKVVDGRGLACPLPLLKTKLALREVNPGQAVYVVATDPNSQADLAAFCRQQVNLGTGSGAATVLKLLLQCTSASAADANATLFHFIITKTDSN